MAKLLITTDEQEVIEVQGKMTFESIRNEEGKLDTYGQLVTHKYIDGIDQIESSRYILKTVNVLREVFGTNDFNILYEFKLDDGYEYYVKEETLSEEAIKKIQDEEYKDEDSNKWEDKEWKSETK